MIHLIRVIRVHFGVQVMNIEHIAFNVPDPVAAAEWYGRHLGMRVVRSVEGSPHTRFLADEAGRVVLEFYRQEKAPVPDYFAIDPMVLHIAFTADDIREARQRVLAAGASAVGEVAPQPNGDDLAMLRDPWGVAVQLVKRGRPLVQ
jgi:catechol 2,3-dioxygenase-like lactoylglutathione lyase family enzyme